MTMAISSDDRRPRVRGQALNLRWGGWLINMPQNMDWALEVARCLTTCDSSNSTPDTKAGWRTGTVVATVDVAVDETDGTIRHQNLSSSGVVAAGGVNPPCVTRVITNTHTRWTIGWQHGGHS